MYRVKKVFKKRKNVGKPKSEPENNNLQNDEASPRPSCSTGTETGTPDIVGVTAHQTPTSTSKLASNERSYDIRLSNNDTEYDIVNLSSLFAQIEDIACCRNCQHKLSFEKSVLAGLAVKLKLYCKNCEAQKETINSKIIKTNITVNNTTKSVTLYEVNLRLVLGLRSIGLGYSAAESLCGVMNLHHPPNRYFHYEKYLGSVSKRVCAQSMKQAVCEAVALNNGERELCVAVDGSWQKRGHTSLNGVLSVTSVDSSKVLDISILSKFCKCPNRLKQEHEPECEANYSGTSGGMEVAGALEVFHQSVPKYNVKYTNYLGDGDSNAFKAVNDSKPYGEEISINKLECIGHIQKRMGTRLRKLKAKGGKLADGKPLGGKNRLTDEAIKKVQLFYGLAIRRNTNSVNAMREAVWAEYHHLLSSNEAPLHRLCPVGPDTWCKYNKALLEGQEYDHDAHFHLNKCVMAAIKPIFTDLARGDLLEKCCKGKTQNPNESLNNTIWSKIPKRIFVSLDTLKFGVYQAVGTFNDGCMTIINTLEEAGIMPGKNCILALRKIDQKRIKHGEKAQLELEKRIRQKRNIAKRRLEDEFEQEEDADNPSYCPGNF